MSGIDRERQTRLQRVAPARAYADDRDCSMISEMAPYMFVIPTFPLRTQHVTSVCVTTLFSDEECEEIIASANPVAWQDGAVGGHGGRGNEAIVPGTRSVSEQYLPVQSNGQSLNKILFEVTKYNATGWSYDLTGFVSDDMPYLMRYTGDRNDHYDWHIDVGYNKNASRKVGFSIQLTSPDDYEGGDLEFMNVDVDKAKQRERGTLIGFPSFRTHRVQPVTSGVRYAIVGWIHGPAFR
ncbi:MAG: 2OG-Fe(II) oxygenase [Pseudomonadota bacterium]|nr:2OG-Fe(II) oxygenase [Pseudomonadota bacterium]